MRLFTSWQSYFIVWFVIVTIVSVGGCDVESPKPTAAPRVYTTSVPTYAASIHTPVTNPTPFVRPTPAPTKVVSTPTQTSAPTVAPVTTSATGIALAAIRAPFDEVGLLEFRGPAEYAGLKPFRDSAGDLVACWIGESAGSDMQLDLCGTEQDLTNIDLLLWWPIEDIETLVLFTLLELVFPDEDSPEWVADNFERAIEGDRPSRRYGHLILSLYVSRGGNVMVSITWG